MEAEVYPEPRVDRLISESFVPVRIHVRENPAAMERFNVQWTPTIVLLGPDGKEHHRIEGFLGVEDFLAQLILGLGHIAFAGKQFERAVERFAEVLERFPATAAAPEAQYWHGVASYKATNDAAALGATAKAFQQKYSDSVWAQKASVWA
ncbi:MAG TPA: tetratricopeptide repeat protein [Thermoanaerobaculia bacterium]|nr:tetratricopeptide repeat protein [Thermoanaerobaculia bacterium]